MLEELIFLSCSQWTYSDKSSKLTIIAAHGQLKGKLFGANKSINAEEVRQVFYMDDDFGDNHLNNNKLTIYWLLDNDSSYPTKPGNII